MRFGDYDYHVPVPPIHGSGDPEIIIALAVIGGGTVGRAYRGDWWEYAVLCDGLLKIHGRDLGSPPGRAVTHHESARALCSFLSAEGESLRWSGASSAYADRYTARGREFLAAEYERFGLAADELSAPELAAA